MNGFALRSGFSTDHKLENRTVNYRINNQGIRSSREYEYIDNTQVDPTNNNRIFIIGDSFTFGWGVEEDEAYPQVLEKILRNNGFDYEVVNLGVPGYGTNHSYNRLVKYSEIIGPPTLVIYMFCFNDPIEDLTLNKVVVDGVRMDDHKLLNRPIAVVRKLYQHSRAIAFIFDVYNSMINPTATKTTELSKQPIDGREDITHLDSEINKLFNWTKYHNIDFLIATTHYSEYDPFLGSKLNELDVPLLEMQYYFDLNNLTDDDIILKSDKFHWTSQAHQIVGKAIYEFLVSNKWIQENNLKH